MCIFAGKTNFWTLTFIYIIIFEKVPMSSFIHISSPSFLPPLFPTKKSRNSKARCVNPNCMNLALMKLGYYVVTGIRSRRRKTQRKREIGNKFYNWMQHSYNTLLFFLQKQKKKITTGGGNRADRGNMYSIHLELKGRLKLYLVVVVYISSCTLQFFENYPKSQTISLQCFAMLPIQNFILQI